ncbi:hypothetical protein JCM14722_21390 [Pseudodesulfovibrio portus]|uniref:Sel1 repeat family protein n=2 Tax=Pseudodesulfovibrio portus TaxID=231439 RepID=A0ABM8AT26_9BACT|nr:hypothetical protein JCM14722_21390 [Pseudodesulfovibrio portus]
MAELDRTLAAIYHAEQLKLCDECNDISDGTDKANQLARLACKSMFCSYVIADDDVLKVIALLKQAASLGSPKANYDLGCMLNKIDKDRAAEHIKTAAELGHPLAQARYAVRLYSEGDINAAIQWYEKAASHGDKDIAARFGMLLYMNSFIENDPQQRARGSSMIRELARGGNIQAQECMVYSTMGGDFDEDYAWLLAQAESGNAQYFYIAGFIYDQGAGVKKDLKTAKTWYEKAVRARSELGGLRLFMLLENEATNQ